MPRTYVSTAAILLALCIGACGEPEPQTVVIYSGRSESLAGPILERFQAQTGITVEVRYGNTAQLAVALSEEGIQTEADLFWAQDAGALGAVQEEGLPATLPDSLLTRVPEYFQNGSGTWVATSGRARVLAYSPERTTTETRPASIFYLAQEPYAGRVGWAPANGSFQAHVTALRTIAGDEATQNWLQAMQENGAKNYPNNRTIVQAIADGEIDLGLPNHYYLYRFLSEDPDFPVEQQFFAAGDAGNLINVAGIAMLASSTRQAAALKLIDFLLSEEAQQYFVQETYEYAVIEGIESPAGLPGANQVVPDIDLDALSDLDGTLDMLREVELL